MLRRMKAPVLRREVTRELTGAGRRAVQSRAMRITVRHYYYFGRDSADIGSSLLSPESWDKLRLANDHNSPFVLPATREGWLLRCEVRQDLSRRALVIAQLAHRRQLRAVFSVGVGCAYLEYHLKRHAPSLHLTCTDYSPLTIERLRTVFKECDRIEAFDIRSWDWPSQPDTLYLLNRVDSEFAEHELANIFSRMRAAGVREVLLVPTTILTPAELCKEWARRAFHVTLGHRMTFAGYLRSRASFEAAWSPNYRLAEQVPLADTSGFYLQPDARQD